MSSKKDRIVELEHAVIRFAGDSGDGMQLTGSLFSDSTAFAGNDFATFPDYPAEIRAPQGTVAGVSGFQIHFGRSDIHTSGDLADVLIAMTIAGLVNAAMLVMAAATFYQQGLTDIGTIEEAHRTLEPLLGSAASIVFAVSLLASGLSSSSVGTMAGQIIMQGFLHQHIPVWIRRIFYFSFYI